MSDKINTTLYKCEHCGTVFKEQIGICNICLKSSKRIARSERISLVYWLSSTILFVLAIFYYLYYKAAEKLTLEGKTFQSILVSCFILSCAILFFLAGLKHHRRAKKAFENDNFSSTKD